MKIIFFFQNHFPNYKEIRALRVGNFFLTVAHSIVKVVDGIFTSRGKCPIFPACTSLYSGFNARKTVIVIREVFRNLNPSRRKKSYRERFVIGPQSS